MDYLYGEFIVKIQSWKICVSFRKLLFGWGEFCSIVQLYNRSTDALNLL